MPINWESGKNRQKLRTALIQVFPSVLALEMFVSDELDLSLEAIANTGSLDTDAFELIKKAKAKGFLETLFSTFYECNRENPIVITLKRELTYDSFAPALEEKISKPQWTNLFNLFAQRDTLNSCQAFADAFKAHHQQSFWTVRPDTPLNEVSHVHTLLERYDDPALTVKFVSRAIAKIKDAGEGSTQQLTALKTWRDDIAKQYGVQEEPEQNQRGQRQGYLLVVLAPSGKRTQGKGVFINLFSEVRVTGEAQPIPFEGQPVNCPLQAVPQYLPKLIYNAEQAIASYGCGKITLELFLPLQHLEVDVAGWKVTDARSSALDAENALMDLWQHRKVMVRSFERAKDSTLQNCLSQNWQKLKAAAAANEICKQFHKPTECPSRGDLGIELEEMPGFQISADLPEDANQRLGILDAIVQAAVPIALWFGTASSYNRAQREIEFDKLLKVDKEKGCITDFSHLARRWQLLRKGQDAEEGKHLKLLCDCPDRWPALPDETQEDDLLVAI